MVIDPKKAQFHWCPFARTRDGSEEVAVNRRYDGKPDSGAMCLGAGCMAWRWLFVNGSHSTEEGYCGLAHH
jgi:hypothetical protein